jgi:hypothetical protein
VCESAEAFRCQVRSGHIITENCQVTLLLKISQSVSSSWARVPDCVSGAYFSLEENFGIVFRGSSTVDGAVMYSGKR